MLILESSLLMSPIWLNVHFLLLIDSKFPQMFLSSQSMIVFTSVSSFVVQCHLKHPQPSKEIEESSISGKLSTVALILKCRWIDDVYVCGIAYNITDAVPMP